MKTTYILHGGNAQHVNEQNDLFFEEVLNRANKSKLKVLLVHFAGRDEKAEVNKERDLAQFERNKKDREIEYQVANRKDFVAQIEWADVVYFGGGTTVRLLGTLSSFSNLKEVFQGKVIAGESAGANFLSELCYSKSGGGTIKGLGILPIFVYPHFENHNEILANIPENLEKVVLSNYQFKVIEA